MIKKNIIQPINDLIEKRAKELKNKIAYADETENISYKNLSESISRSANMVGLYEELSLQRIDKDSLRSFLTKASTLLSVIKDSFVSDPNIALSIKEENFLSIHDLEADGA